MPLNIKLIAPDRSHDTEYPGVISDGAGRFAGTDVDGEVHDAVRYFHLRRGAKMLNGRSP